jgi:hypothetical protein
LIAYIAPLTSNTTGNALSASNTIAFGSRLFNQGALLAQGSNTTARPHSSRRITYKKAMHTISKHNSDRARAEATKMQIEERNQWQSVH